MNIETTAPWKNIFDPAGFFGSVVIGAVSGGAAGVVAGVLARIAMRVVAVLGGMTPSFSIEGTLGILVIGALIGAGPGLLYAISLPVWKATPIRKGLVIGLSLALLIVVVLFSVDAEGELALAPIWAVAAMFGGIALVYGLVLGTVAGRLVPVSEVAPPDSARFLLTAGTLTLIGGLLSGSIELFQAAWFPAQRTVGTDVARALEALAGFGTILAIITGLAGLLRSGAAGSNRVVNTGLGIALAFFTILGLGSVFDGAGMFELHGLVRAIGMLEYNPDLLVLLIFLGAGILFLLAAGVAVLRARRWSGWRRFTPLAVGLLPVLSIPILLPSLLPELLNITVFGRQQLGHWVGALFGLAWLALGIAMRVEAAAGQSSPIDSGADPMA